MIVSVIKGTEEIGGTWIELRESGSSILLDLGKPLKKDSLTRDLKYLRTDAIIVSHPHVDHYGLIEAVDPKIPVYMGKIGRSLIDAARIFRGLKPMPNDFRSFEAWQPFSIGPFTITAYPVDHSAPEAFAFMVEASGKRVFYSGDFRAHGKKAVLTERLMQKPPKNIALLLMEGTMMKRSNVDFPTEESVYDKILSVIKDQKHISFLICSGQNIDRISSAYKACARTDKTMVTDIYTAWVLEQFVRHNAKTGVPNLNWGKIRVIFLANQKAVLQDCQKDFAEFAAKCHKHRIFGKEMEEAPANFLSVGRMSSVRAIQKYENSGTVNVIYSQWMGYIKDPEFATRDSKVMTSFMNNQDPKVNFFYAHTSGHAGVPDLKRFARALNPAQLLPIHTEAPQDFDKHFRNTKILHAKDCQAIFLVKNLDHEVSQKLLHKIIEILYAVDPMSLVHMTTSSDFMTPEEATASMANEYEPEAREIVNRFNEWQSVDNLELIIKKIFHHYFALSDRDDIHPAYYTKAAREIWNIYREINGKSKTNFPELKMPKRPKPISIKVD